MRLWSFSTCNDGDISTSIYTSEILAYKSLAQAIYPENDGGNDKHGRLIALLDGGTITPEIEGAFATAAEEDMCETFWTIQPHEGESPTSSEVFHLTALALCEHHKRTCDGVTCNISLGSIREMAEAAGAVFTEAERKEFM